MTATGYANIEERDGTLYITGTGIKLVLLIGEHVYWDFGPEDLHDSHPDLTLGQIHSALGYYHDHKSEIERELARRRRFDQEMRAETEARLDGTALGARFKALRHGR